MWYFLEEKHLAWKIGLFDDLLETIGQKTDMHVSLERSEILEDSVMEEINDESSEISFKDGGSRALSLLRPAYDAPTFEEAAKQLASCELQP